MRNNMYILLDYFARLCFRSNIYWLVERNIQALSHKLSLKTTFWINGGILLFVLITRYYEAYIQFSVCIVMPNIENVKCFKQVCETKSGTAYQQKLCCRFVSIKAVFCIFLKYTSGFPKLILAFKDTNVDCDTISFWHLGLKTLKN